MECLQRYWLYSTELPPQKLAYTFEFPTASRDGNLESPIVGFRRGLNPTTLAIWNRVHGMFFRKTFPQRRHDIQTSLASRKSDYRRLLITANSRIWEASLQVLDDAREQGVRRHDSPTPLRLIPPKNS